MKKPYIILLLGLILVSGCVSEQESTTTTTTIPENLTKICEDCIVINVSDAYTKEPVVNASVKLEETVSGLLVVGSPYSSSFRIEKVTDENGIVILYKNETSDYKDSDYVTISAKGYNTTVEEIDYEFNSQMINYELIPDIKYCEVDDDCARVGSLPSCCGCSAGGYDVAINKKYVDYWNSKCPSEVICQTVIRPCYKMSCINNTCQMVED